MANYCADHCVPGTGIPGKACCLTCPDGSPRYSVDTEYSPLACENRAHIIDHNTGRYVATFTGRQAAPLARHRARSMNRDAA